jgi:hypothetical protein
MTRGAINPLILDPRSFPLVRPQITCIDEEVYFGSYAIARVSSIEASFLNACTGQFSLANAAGIAGVDPTCVARVASWLLWWRQAVEASPQPRRRVDRLVLSATYPGAWLGMAGRLLMEAWAKPTAVITCMGSLGDTRFIDAFPTLAAVSMVCRDEVAFVARLAGVQQSVLDFPDEDLRARMLAEGRDIGPLVEDTLRASLLRILEEHQPAQIFAPAAMGESCDNRLLFDILVSLFAEGSIGGELHLYEDEPATEGHRQVDEFLSRFEGSYLRPSEYFVDVTSSFAERLSVMDVFRGSMDQDLAGPWSQSAQRNALLAGLSGGIAERFWELNIASFEMIRC